MSAMVTPDSMPNISPQPKSRKACGSLVMGMPCVAISDSPRYIYDVARVIIKAFMRVTCMRTPLSAPMEAPMSSATPTQSPTGSSALSAFAMHIALKESMDPTERSMAPEEIMHIIPTAISMRYEFASSIFTAFFTEKNEFVRTERNAAIMPQKHNRSSGAMFLSTNRFRSFIALPPPGAV